MLPKKLIGNKVSEETAREYLLSKFNRFGISEIQIDKTPLGMKVVLRTPKPGILITRAGAALKAASTELGRHFKQDPPHIDVEQTENALLDPEAMADSICFKIAKHGPMKYKIVAHRALEDIMNAGAKGAEIEIGGVIKERAAHFKFRPHGSVMPKTGQIEQFGVRKAKKQLLLKRGSIGIKVTIVVPVKMPGGVEFKHGREHKGAEARAPENEHKENAGTAAS